MQNKRPLVGIALLFCAGILTASIAAFPYEISGLLLVVFLLGFLGLYTTRLHRLVFWPIPFLAGLFAFHTATQHRSPDDLRNLIGDRPQHVAVRGVVNSWPETKSKATPRGAFESTSVMLRVESIRRATHWEPARGEVTLQIMEFEEHLPLFYGDEIEFNGTIEEPPVARNPGQFDYRQYLARQDVYYCVRASDASALRKLSARRGPWLMQLAADANEYFKHCLGLGIGSESQTVGLLRAIVLGFRPGLTDELAEPFMRTGTLHVFAVSGFHIALVASILVGALRLCRLSRRASGLASIPLLVVYTLITGAPPSATRSLIMAIVIILGWTLLRPHDIYNSLAAAALIVLTLNPRQLFDAGFQLSFFVVLTIAVFAPRVHDRLLRWAKPDPFLPWDVVPKWRRLIFHPLSQTLLFFSVSFAAVIGSAPLIATYFNLVTPIALVSNLLIVPLCGCVIGLGFGSMVTGSLLPWATTYFNNTNFLLLHITLRINEWFASLPWGYWYVTPPPLPLTLAYYAVAFAWLSGWAWKTRTRKFTSLAATAGFLIALIASQVSPRPPATMTVLDVGGGQAVVVNQPGAAHVLIDGGRRSQGDAVVRPYLRTCGIKRLGAIVLTVNDINHAGGLVSITQRFAFDRFLESNYRSRSTEYRELIDSVSGDERHQRIAGGHARQIGTGVLLQFLSPPEGRLYNTADDNSVVIRMECEGYRVLFKSEVGETVERDILESGLDLTSDIVVAGQHARESSTTDAFLDRVQPKLIILNTGSFPPAAYPRPDLLDRLARRKITIYRTDRDGGIVVVFRRDALEVTTTLPSPHTTRFSRTPR